MALVSKDRVLETSTTTGTGTITLAGATAGYQAFSAIGNGNTVEYCIEAINASGVPTGDWETGLGTYTLAGTLLARTTVYASSNGGAAVNFAAGTKRVFGTRVAVNLPDLIAANTFTAVQTVNTNAAAAPTPATGTGIQVVGTDATITRVEADSFGAIAAFTARRANGTGAAPTALLSGDQIGSFNFHGFYVTGGPAYSGVQANLMASATQNWTSTTLGTKVVIRTTPNGSTTLTDAATFGQDGSLAVAGLVTAPTANIATTYGATTADVDAATVTFNAATSNRHALTLTDAVGANRTLAITGDSDGQVIILWLTQGGTGNKTVTWFAGITWSGGAVPVLSTSAGTTDTITIIRKSAGVYFGFSSTVLGTPVNTPLTATNIWVGNASNVAAAVAMSGNATLSNAGVLTIGAAQVTNAMLAGGITVPNGGTGNSTFTAFAVLCAGTTATGAFQNVSGVGSSGQVLTSNGAAALPTWQSAPAPSAGGADTQVQFNNATVLAGSAQFTFATTTGTVTIAPAVRTTGSPSCLVVTSPADTTLTATTESSSVIFNNGGSRQWTGGGTLALQRENVIAAPTYRATSATTFTRACTLEITGAPIASTNMTITAPYALRVPSGSIGIAAGTVSQCGLSFATSLNTGIYDGSAAIRFAFGGAQMMSITGSIVNLYAATLNFTDTGALNGVGLSRPAAKVLTVTDASAGLGWIQNSAGTARLTANVTESAGTLTNLTDLSMTVIAGRKYVGRLQIIANDSVGADGLQIDFGGGAATFTSINFGFAGAPNGATVGTASSAAATTPITATVVATTDVIYDITIAFVCNAGGTIIPRIAQVTHTTGTATVKLNSHLLLNDSPN